MEIHQSSPWSPRHNCCAHLTPSICSLSISHISITISDDIYPSSLCWLYCLLLNLLEPWHILLGWNPNFARFSKHQIEVHGFGSSKLLFNFIIWYYFIWGIILFGFQFSNLEILNHMWLLNFKLVSLVHFLKIYSRWKFNTFSASIKYMMWSSNLSEFQMR